MSSNKINQSGSVVFGDQVAGDKHIHEAPVSSLKELASRLKEECVLDPDFKGFVEELQHLINRKESTHEGLEEKLRGAGFEDHIEEALLLKERFYKKIVKTEFSNLSQNIYTHILTQIHTVFKFKILPMIKASQPKADIEKAIYEQILSSIYESVGSSALNINMDDIQGMLFFLTGNCYIKWR